MKSIIPQSLNYYVDGARRYAGSVTWTPLVQLSRSAILSTLQKITVGQLKVIEADGHTTICGELGADIKGPQTELRIHKDTFWVRMLLFADMVRRAHLHSNLMAKARTIADLFLQGFAESFMLAEVSCPSLTNFFTIFLQNRTALSNGTTLTSGLSSSLTFLASRTNTLANARLHISAHYDISNAMFAAFLSRDMTYSCPIWLPTTDPKHESETLEDAQMTKLQRFIDRAHIKASDHVLEIGTGWGSFAIRAVQQTGCRVTSLTLSTEQKSLAEERIAAAGLTERIEVLLCDYRALPIPKEGGRYDKIVSIEMLEAVGKEFLETYFECVDKLLKEDGGIACFQCITMPETVCVIFNSSKQDGTTTNTFPSATPRTPLPPISSANTFSPAATSPPSLCSSPL